MSVEFSFYQLCIVVLVELSLYELSVVWIRF